MPRERAEDLLAAPSISEFLSAWLEDSWLGEEEQRQLRRYYASYTSHFGPYLRQQYGEQTRELLSHVSGFARPRVLEVGCGCGTESLYLALRGARVVGIDINQDRLRVARDRLGVLEELSGKPLQCRFEARSIFDLGEGPGFDIVWMEQAFHHLEPRARVLEQLPRLLAPRGVLIVSEANAWNPLVQLQFALKRGFRTVGEYEDAAGRKHPYGVERILTPLSLARSLRTVGVETTSVRYFRLLPNWELADSLTELEKYLPQKATFPFTHYNLVARKADLNPNRSRA
jgi:SAM-dependent methyltransferase